MSTPAPTPPATSGWRAWKDFWFLPADPTTLGFIRVCTGLLVLYIHMAYSLDLQSFFGKHGWYAAEFVDRERHESPSFASPWSWDEPFVIPQISEFPHRRAAVMDFLRSLPADPAARKNALRYLNRANEYPNPDQFRVALVFVQRMGTNPAELARFTDALLDRKVEKVPDGPGGPGKPLDMTASYADQVPPFFRELEPAQKQQVADELRAFWAVLPKDDDARTYVFHQFTEVNPDLRKALVEYIWTLPDDPTERARVLDYLDYWNRDPRKALRTGSAIFSVWFHVTDPTQMAFVHAAVLVIMAMFTVGLFTRVTSVLTWLAAVMYIHRTQQVLFGMDTMMNILLLYLMIGNSGAALSVDRLIARYRAARASLRRSGTIDPATRAFLACPPPSAGAGFALRLIQVHFCFIYMAAGLSKLKGGAWWDGRAFWDVAINPEFSLVHYQWYENLVRAVASSKPVYQFLAITGVWFTIFVEIATPFLVWTRWRWLMILLATAMHAIIGVMMGLNLFELLMIVMLLAFLPDRVIRDRFRAGPDLPRLAFAFNPQDQTQARAAALALALDADNQVSLTPDRGAAVPAATGPEKKPVTGAEGMTLLARNVRMLSALSWLLWVPGVKALLTHKLFPAARPPAAPVVKPPITPPVAR